MDDDNTGEFKKSISKWLAVDAEIKEYNAALRKLRAEKKQCAQYIINIMKSKQIDEVDTSTARLQYSSRRVPSAYSTKYIRDKLSELFPSRDITELVQQLDTGRKTTIKEELKRAKATPC